MSQFKAKVEVVLKSGVLDPQGKAVEGGLASLHFKNISQVRVGKLIELKLEAASRDEAAKAVQTMCEKLLANTVMEKFSFQVETA